MPIPDGSEYEKFRKMQKALVPDGAIKIAMQRDKIDPAVIKASFPEEEPIVSLPKAKAAASKPDKTSVGGLGLGASGNAELAAKLAKRQAALGQSAADATPPPLAAASTPPTPARAEHPSILEAMIKSPLLDKVRQLKGGSDQKTETTAPASPIRAPAPPPPAAIRKAAPAAPPPVPRGVTLPSDRNAESISRRAGEVNTPPSPAIPPPPPPLPPVSGPPPAAATAEGKIEYKINPTEYPHAEQSLSFRQADLPKVKEKLKALGFTDQAELDSHDEIIMQGVLKGEILIYTEKADDPTNFTHKIFIPKNINLATDRRFVDFVDVTKKGFTEAPPQASRSSTPPAGGVQWREDPSGGVHASVTKYPTLTRADLPYVAPPPTSQTARRNRNAAAAGLTPSSSSSTTPPPPPPPTSAGAPPPYTTKTRVEYQKGETKDGFTRYYFRADDKTNLHGVLQTMQNMGAGLDNYSIKDGPTTGYIVLTVKDDFVMPGGFTAVNDLLATQPAPAAPARRSTNVTAFSSSSTAAPAAPPGIARGAPPAAAGSRSGATSTPTRVTASTTSSLRPAPSPPAGSPPVMTPGATAASSSASLLRPRTGTTPITPTPVRGGTPVPTTAVNMRVEMDPSSGKQIIKLQSGMAPDVLQQIVKDVIRSVIDSDIVLPIDNSTTKTDLHSTKSTTPGEIIIKVGYRETGYKDCPDVFIEAIQNKFIENGVRLQRTGGPPI